MDRPLACAVLQQPAPTDFSIGHRGAPLQFPEHTKESYVAAARMGAGIIECDVTFTKDRRLVCRHAQCDLHTTTNILAIPELAAKCTQPFVPADPTTGTPASAKCCTSDIKLAEFKQLCGKMDGFNPNGTTVAQYMAGTADFCTDLYSSCGTLVTHAESIQLIKSVGSKFTPELKAPEVEMPYEGDYTQEDYAQQLIDEYRAARIPARNVFAQSFNLDDVLYWIANEPAFGRQAVFLDARVDTPDGYAARGMADLAGASDVRAGETECQQPDRSVRVRAGRATAEAGHHHLDPGAFRIPGERWRLLLPVRVADHGQRRRRVHGPRRARDAGRHPGDLLGLAGHGDLLRELHGSLSARLPLSKARYSNR